MTHEHEIDWDDTMLRQVRPDAFPRLMEARMSEQKHTPGEWAVDERKSYFGVFSKPPSWLGQARLVAACAKPHPDAQANARLIAAAPDLVEALLLAKEWLEGWGSAEQQLAIIEAALAKAGVTP